MNDEQTLRPRSPKPSQSAASEADAGPSLRERALEALHARRFDLVEELLSREGFNQEALIENLRIYQAELEIQNGELIQSQARTQQALGRFTAFFNTLPIAELVIDRHGLIHEANPAAQRLFGLDQDHLRQHFFARLIAKPDRERVVLAWTNLTKGGIFLPEIRLRTREGEAFIGDLHLAILPPLGEEIAQYVCAIIDRTEMVRQRQCLQETTERLRESYDHYRVLADFSSDWEFWRDVDGGYLYVSPACEKISGYPPQAFILDPDLFGRLILDTDRERWQTHLERIQSDPATPQQILELRIRSRDGEVHWIEHVCIAVLDADNRFLGRRGVNRDITERKRFEEQLEYLAQHDALTGLFNRTYLQVRLEQCLQRARRYRRQCALLFLDLDRFKEINDTLGHGVGDDLLRQIADLLKAEVRSVDTLARLGGDEFVILLEDIPEPRFAAHFAERILDLFKQTLVVADHSFLMTASIGISLYPGDAQDAETLIQHADLAMYRAKQSGRNGFSFFAPEMSKGVAERRQIEQDLRLVLDQQALILHYQPQVNLITGQLVGIEAICRWLHPQLGLLTPERFLPVVDDMGLSDELNLRVLEAGCRQMAAWDSAALWVPRLSVKLAGSTLDRSESVERIAGIVQASGLDAERLVLEIGESSLMTRSEALGQTLTDLRALGANLVLDNFGVACFSLSRIGCLPLTQVKISRSLVAGIGQGGTRESVVRVLIGAARALGWGVLAAGIETVEQANFLAAEGCLEGSGPLYGRPLPADALAAQWLLGK
ncbi:EAL domain-containing protein [Caldichromatium japonicum]|uniref:EAL domain-containing protein n=1 Tax=Caldichromatium japonicum TaxID=2699430 RepID=A0A6G7VAI3_9GAMM|nr:bifunctional diguanylate cyclase/phosphodiesterase [Caldichromatium japonicum]QIK36920.1 EAL domain-containing protein [Caldichromatium japonicum]